MAQIPDQTSQVSRLEAIPRRLTRQATTRQLQRRAWSTEVEGRMLPLIQAQISVVQDLLCGKYTEKALCYRKEGPGLQGRSGRSTGSSFLVLGLGVVLNRRIDL